MPTTNWIASLNGALAALRAAKGLDQLSIVLMAPNTSDYVPAGHTPAYHENMQPLLRQAARKYSCCFIDTYSFLKDSTNAQATLWLDSLLTHPLSEMNLQIAGLICDTIFPMSVRQWGTRWHTNPLFTGTKILYTLGAGGMGVTTNTILVTNGQIAAWLQNFTPSSVSGLYAWYDATTITNPDNTSLTTWYDRSGNGFNATQFASVAPTFKAAGLNGKPSVLFNGIGSELSTTGTGIGRPYTAFFVAQSYNGADTALRVFFGDMTSTSNLLYAMNIPGAGAEVFAEYGPDQFTWSSMGSFTLGQPYLYEASHVADGYPIMRINGTPLNYYRAWGNAGSGGFTNFLLGGVSTADNVHYNAYLSEVLIYSGVLTDSDRANVEAYLRSKWGLW